MSEAAQLPLPLGWEEMEIESKWEFTEEKFRTLIKEFSHQTELFDYEVRERWGGIARRFLDVYYDTPDNALGMARHSIRHRSRSVSKPRAKDNEPATLEAAHWEKQWERIQYKGTPCRIEAAWLRTESGDCKLSDEDGKDLCCLAPVSAGQVLSGEFPNHEAIVGLKQDHLTLDLSRLKPLLNVVDYRYRIELFDPASKKAIYEISLDRVLSTNLRTGKTWRSFEAELEIVADMITVDMVHGLLKLSEEFEKRFNLASDRSKTSKGGVEVSACSATGSAK